MGPAWSRRGRRVLMVVPPAMIAGVVFSGPASISCTV
jgi:hypothetical protein